MVCPLYQGEKTCDIHSEFYDLPQETIEKYCKKDHLSCREFLENNKKPQESFHEIRDINDTYTAIATIVKRESSFCIPSEKERLELKCDFSWVGSIPKFNQLK